MVEIKYYLDKQTLRTGAEKSFMKRHLGWYIYSILAGCLFIGLGVYFASQKRGFEVLPYVLITCGVIVLLKKQFYLRKVVKGVLAGKSERQEVHGKFTEDEIWMKTENAEGTTKWEGLYDAIITEEGILLYPQKSIHQWIPRSAEMINGDWEELVRLSARVARKSSHLPLQ